MVTRLKLIYKKNRIYRIVLMVIFLFSFSGMAFSVNMQDPSFISTSLSKWEYRSYMEQSCIIAEILFELSVVLFGAGCIIFATILHDDVVLHQQDYQILMNIGFGRGNLVKIVIIRYLPCCLIPALLAVRIEGIKAFSRHFVFVVIMLIILIGWSFKAGIISSLDSNAKKTQAISKKKLTRRNVLFRYLFAYKNYGISLMFVVAIYVFVGAFCTCFVFNSVFNETVFKKNFFVNNSDIDIEWNDYDLYQKNIGSLREAFAGNDERIYMFLDEDVVIDDYRIDAYISDSFAMVSSPMCLCGRVPLYDNEISVGAAFAKLQGIGIGDMITVSVNNNQCRYLVTGIIQAADMGFDCELTYDGYQRLVPKYVKANTCIQLGKNCKENEIDAILNELSQRYQKDARTLENKMVQSKQLFDNYKRLITYITILLMLGITFVVILFSRLLINGGSAYLQPQLRLLHFIGFSLSETNRLENEILFFYQLLGLVCGLLLSLLLNPIFNFIFSKIGMFKIEFEYPIGIIVFVSFVEMLSVVVSKPKLRQEEY